VRLLESDGARRPTPRIGNRLSAAEAELDFGQILDDLDLNILLFEP
jgi:hypothetical protein